MVVWIFLAVPWVCLRFVIVVFPEHTHLLFCSLGTVPKAYIGIQVHREFLNQLGNVLITRSLRSLYGICCLHFAHRAQNIQWGTGFFVAKHLIKYPIVYSFSSKSTTKNISVI